MSPAIDYGNDRLNFDSEAPRERFTAAGFEAALVANASERLPSRFRRLPTRLPWRPTLPRRRPRPAISRSFAATTRSSSRGRLRKPRRFMGDAMVGHALQAHPGQRWFAMRDASDPQMPNSNPNIRAADEAAGKIFSKYGVFTTAASVIATWAAISALSSRNASSGAVMSGDLKRRICRLIPKTHAHDAACVGVVGDVRGPAQPTLTVQCTGHVSRQRTRVNPSGFPVGYRMRPKSVHGLHTGDRVVASVPARSKRVVDYAGRVAVRASGSFNLPTPHGAVQGISHKHCRVVQRADGYGYSFNPAPTKERKRES